jgi:hypothetical protein
MDPQRFDRWTRSLHSRRAVVPALVGLGFGLGITRQTIAAPTPTKKGKGRFGCTKQASTCRTGMDAPCPLAPGGTCAVNAKGKPVCISDGECFACKRNADCPGAGTQCVKCAFCQGMGTSTACVVPFAP